MRGALSEKHKTQSRICEFEPHNGCRDYLNKLKKMRNGMAYLGNLENTQWV